MAGEPSAGVAAVVIGRNEGVRLERCLASLSGRVGRIVYVDSGSSDGSVAHARSVGAQVVALDADSPFTAARARNAGFAALDPPPRYVQFVDGDCEVAPGWIESAIAFLDSHTDAAVACGRRRERSPETSIYNRLCDMEWNTPVGEAGACGGDSLMRAAAVEAAGGFDPTLIAGEEPEFCLRLRRAGWTIWRLDAEMTLHDAAMTRFGQWWRRTLRAGWACAEGVARHGDGPERYNRRTLRSILLWGAAVPVGTIGAGAVAAIGAAVGAPVWPVALVGAVGGVALYPAMALRIARRRSAQFGDRAEDSVLYGAMTMLGKIPECLGVLRYWRAKRSGRVAQIIEYKDPAASA